MDVRLLGNDLTTEVWSCPTIRHNLKNLESLEFPLLDLKTSRTTFINSDVTDDDGIDAPEEAAINFQHSATTLAETATLKRLQAPI